MRFVKERKHGSTLHILHSAGNFKYVLIGEGLAAGLCAGLIAVLYRIILGYAEDFVAAAVAFIRTDWTHIVLWFAFLLILGFLVTQLLKAEPLISGSGIPQVEGEIMSFIDQQWTRVLPAKVIGGTLCAFGGLSLGREGPSIQLGAMAGKAIAKLFHRVKMEERLLLTCGAAAGLAAAFNAPLAGVMFALEEIHKNFSVSVLISVMCASVSGDFLSRNVFGLAPAFHFEVLNTFPLGYYWMLILLGIVCGLFGVLYNKSTMKVQALFAKSGLQHYGVMVAMLLSGVLALCLSDVLGSGHAMIEMLSENPVMMLRTLFLLLAVKFAFSLISFGSGAPGGIFFPLLVLGSFTGAIFGNIAVQVFGFSAGYMNNIIIMAMAGAFAAIVRAPITGIILIAEMSGTLTNLLPLAVVSLISYLCASLLNCEPIYESLLHNLLVKNGVNLSAFHGERHLVEAVVELGSPVCDQAICDVKWPKKCLLISIERQGKELLPKGSTVLHTGDKLIALLDDEDAPYIQHQLEKCCSSKLE